MNILNKKNIFFRYSILMSLCALMLIFIFYNNTSDASTREVANFVNHLGSKVTAIIKREDIGGAEKRKRLAKIFKRVVDTKWIGRFAMGRYWRTATKNQKITFQNLYTQYLVETYVPNFEQYTGGGFNIVHVVETRANEYLVQTEVVLPGGTRVRIDYMLSRKSANRYVVFDIVAQGVSLITTQRSEFGSIISESGVEGLIKHLREKVE